MNDDERQAAIDAWLLGNKPTQCPTRYAQGTIRYTLEHLEITSSIKSDFYGALGNRKPARIAYENNMGWATR